LVRKYPKRFVDRAQWMVEDCAKVGAPISPRRLRGDVGNSRMSILGFRG
jgi:hypothetical protein